MSGTLDHLGGNRWRVRVYEGSPDGKNRQRSKSFRAEGRRVAERKAPSVIVALQKDIENRKTMRGTVAELVGVYEAHRLSMGKWSPTHAKRQHEILAVIVVDLGRFMCADLTARHVDQWYATLLGRGLAPRTVHHYAAALRACLRQGARWDMSTERAVANSTLPTVPNVEVRPPTNAVVQLLLSTSTGALRAALAVAMYTACRRGEVIGLRWSDFDGSTLKVARSVCEVHRELTVKAPKSGKTRTFTVDPGLAAELGAWRAAQNEQFRTLGQPPPSDCFIFADLRHDPSGQRPRRPDWLSLAWDRHRKAHKANTVRLHDLRHWHLSTLAAAGVPMTTIQARGGHADISTTGIYSHALPEGEEKTRGVISKALASGKPKPQKK